MLDLTPLPSGEPRRVTPTSPTEWFEVLTRAVFVAGLSWQVVEARWPAIGAAFAGFDPAVVATYDDGDVDRLAADPAVVRSRAKLAAVVANAQTFVELTAAHGHVATWLCDQGDHAARARALQRSFRYIGPFGAWWVQWTCGLDVPDPAAWAAARERAPAPLPATGAGG